MNARILLVESELDSAKVLQDMLKSVSYGVYHVPTFTEARTFLAEHPIDGLLIDIDDLEYSWPSFYEWLRESPEFKSLPLVAITSKDSAIIGFEKDDLHNKFFSKPLSPRRFLQAVQEFLADFSAKETSLFMESMPTSSPTQNSVSSVDPEEAFDRKMTDWIRSLEGVTLGSFTIEKEIGRGGMGAVFRGKQASLERPVAIKVLLPHLVKKKSTVERFRREALAAAKLKSPHVVQIFETGGGEDDQLFFIAMEWLEGKNLEEYVKEKGQVPFGEALGIVRQVLKGLKVAHKEGLIHRDLKPSNLILSDTGHVTITDFGLVLSQEAPRHTQEGMVIGTPHYLSPEQASGHEIDGRSDIYSLGILFYELLTGEVPFPATSLMDLLMAHVKKPIPDPRDVVPGIPEIVVQFIQKMCAKLPDERFSNVGELLKIVKKASAMLHPSGSDDDLPFVGPQAAVANHGVSTPQSYHIGQPFLGGQTSAQTRNTPFPPQGLNQTNPYDNNNQTPLPVMKYPSDDSMTPPPKVSHPSIWGLSSSSSSSGNVIPAEIGGPQLLPFRLLQEFTQLYITYAGPIGQIVVNQTIIGMGFQQENFPTVHVRELLEKLAARIALDKQPLFLKKCRALLAKNKVG